MALELEVAQELLFLQHQREPEDVVRPHFAVGDFVDVKPLGPHF